MPKEYQRAERVADYLQQELALLIAREIRDPRLNLVDVTGVEVSRDLSSARVYVSFPGESTVEEDKEREGVLNGAAGFLRSQLAKGHTMRSTPRLKFFYDESIRRGSYLTKLIDDALESDQRLTGGDESPDSNDS
ncbi:MAG: 30S ribosome-binding factor RbfA [Pseudomonadales bacterium]